MIKILTFCLSVMFVINLQADTTDSKWKNIIELKKTGDHCKDDANCFNRYHPAIERVVPRDFALDEQFQRALSPKLRLCVGPEKHEF